MEKLQIVIIGAGLSGLAASIQCALAGHYVKVLESAKELAEVCSLLQSTPAHVPFSIYSTYTQD